MTIHVPIAPLGAYQAKLLHDHRARQRKFAAAARNVTPLEQGRNTHNQPEWKRANLWFDAHIRAFEAHLANRMVRPGVIYLKRRAAEIGIPYRDIVGRSPVKAVIEARRMLMAELREQFELSYVEIGRAFGWRDQSTVVSALRTIAADRQRHMNSLPH